MESREPKRHLPVIGAVPSAEEGPPAAWLWSMLGGVVVVGTWVPLAIVVTSIGNTLIRTPIAKRETGVLVVVALLLFGTFAVSCWLGGALVGRFSQSARRRDSVLAGVWGCSFVLLLAALGNALRPALVGAIVAVGLVLVALPLAALGGRWGERRRSAASNE
jgi:hypothetical protein